MVEFKFVPCCRFVAGKDRHPSSHPSRALAPVCVDLDCMIIGAIGFNNVFKFSRVRPSVDFDFTVDVLCVRDPGATEGSDLFPSGFLMLQL